MTTINIKQAFTAILLLGGIFLNGCKKDDNNEPTPTTTPEQSFSPGDYAINGYAQKGPFVQGSSITIYELDESLTPTGKTFETTIKDDKGTFEFPKVPLVSPYVQLKANGYYFDEHSGTLSGGSLTLYSMTKVFNPASDNNEISNSINVNILTHLEKDRIQYLMKQGKTFEESKKQAEKEILAIFDIEKLDMQSADNLDISKEGDDNAILLAVSVILQGHSSSIGNSTAILTELASKIINDIKEDGILNSTDIKNQLVNNTKDIMKYGIWRGKIRENITKRYADLGVETTISDFEKYVYNFIKEYLDIDYSFEPLVPNNPNLVAQNLLLPTASEYGPEELFPGFPNEPYYYSITTILPNTSELKVKIKIKQPSGINTWHIAFPEYNEGWEVGSYDSQTKEQVFTAKTKGKPIVLYFTLDPLISFDVKIYENNATTPTRTSSYVVQDPNQFEP